jgi:hypothetical protein
MEELLGQQCESVSLALDTPSKAWRHLGRSANEDI